MLEINLVEIGWAEAVIDLVAMSNYVCSSSRRF
jgi:hypothetical protein